MGGWRLRNANSFLFSQTTPTAFPCTSWGEASSPSHWWSGGFRTELINKASCRATSCWKDRSKWDFHASITVMACSHSHLDRSLCSYVKSVLCFDFLFNAGKDSLYVLALWAYQVVLLVAMATKLVLSGCSDQDNPPLVLNCVCNHLKDITFLLSVVDQSLFPNIAQNAIVFCLLRHSISTRASRVSKPSFQL